ncbi:hypothetical protein PV396_26480 [Streptomyces sp. ME02-8801-2C]|nr:hypothetical protein [Streptomyces sp. ME02-8801-2C]MDX3455440.1 hypothetical protein [Streptomyces sp. ME02-8801-2C]
MSRAISTSRSLAVSALRLVGATNIAAALRHNARNANSPLALLGIN